MMLGDNDNADGVLSFEEFDEIVRETLRTMLEAPQTRGCDRKEMMLILEAAIVATVGWLYEDADQVEAVQRLTTDVLVTIVTGEDGGEAA